VNVSSPNTRDLRQLQGADELGALAGKLKTEQNRLADAHGRYVPLVLKIAPDLDHAQLGSIAKCLLKHKLDGVIATNTTVSRLAVKGLPHAEETGGLFGAPLRDVSTQVIRTLAQRGEMAILLVEQYYDFARSLADHYVVMSRGEVIKSGACADMERENVKACLAL